MRRLGGLSASMLVLGIAASACIRPYDAELPHVLRVQPVSSAAEDACRASAEALCARAAACSPLYVTFFFETIAECEAMVTDTCASRYEGPGASSAPADCIAAARAAPCEIVTNPAASVFLNTPALEMLAVCPVTAGRFADHAPCLRDGDCTSGACGELLAGIGCLGCIPQRREGEPCDDVTARCARPLGCLGGRCVAPKADGEACDDAHACASGTCAVGRCAPLLGEAAPCGMPGAPDCDLGHALVCADDHVCRPVVIVGPGEACEPFPGDIPKAGTRLCDARAGCNDHVCEPVPRRGEACTKACRYGLACRDGRCEVELLRSSRACTPPP